MNRTELQNELMKIGASPDSFSLYGELRPGIIISQEDGKWVVHSRDDRGCPAGAIFRYDSEEKACIHIYNKLKKIVDWHVKCFNETPLEAWFEVKGKNYDRGWDKLRDGEDII